MLPPLKPFLLEEGQQGIEPVPMQGDLLARCEEVQLVLEVGQVGYDGAVRPLYGRRELEGDVLGRPLAYVPDADVHIGQAAEVVVDYDLRAPHGGGLPFLQVERPAVHLDHLVVGDYEDQEEDDVGGSGGDLGVGGEAHGCTRPFRGSRIRRHVRTTRHVPPYQKPSHKWGRRR